VVEFLVGVKMLNRRGFLKFVLGFPFFFVSRRESAKRFLLLETFIAGYRYYNGEMVEWTFYSGKPVLLRREPENPYDPMAIEVYTTEGVKLGYIPRKFNQVPARLMDQGAIVRAEIKAVYPLAEPWERVKIALFMEVADA